jgi:hypothetical protein
MDYSGAVGKLIQKKPEAKNLVTLPFKLSGISCECKSYKGKGKL